MEDLRVRKLREKLGISAADQKAAAGRAVSPNLQKKISGYARAGGNFVSAPSMAGTAVADHRLGTGGNFVSAPSVTGTAAS